MRAILPFEQDAQEAGIVPAVPFAIEPAPEIQRLLAVIEEDDTAVGIDTMGELASLQTHATALHARLKQALDPDDLLAPGRYA